VALPVGLKCYELVSSQACGLSKQAADLGVRVQLFALDHLFWDADQLRPILPAASVQLRPEVLPTD